MLKAAGIKIGAPVKKAILGALSERDEDADICIEGDSHPEPDAELRDYELVPLTEDWRACVEREVKPFVPDAWVDETYRDARDGEVGRVGYEPACVAAGLAGTKTTKGVKGSSISFECLASNSSR